MLKYFIYLATADPRGCTFTVTNSTGHITKCGFYVPYSSPLVAAQSYCQGSNGNLYAITTAAEATALFKWMSGQFGNATNNYYRWLWINGKFSENSWQIFTPAATPMPSVSDPTYSVDFANNQLGPFYNAYDADCLMGTNAWATAEVLAFECDSQYAEFVCEIY